MKKYYPALQGFRVILFINIFFFHILGFIQNRNAFLGFFEYGGWLGVSGFFVLSGFLTGATYKNTDNDFFVRSTVAKVKRFFKKYYLLHIMFTCVMTPFIIVGLSSGEWSVGKFFLAVISQLTLTQSQIPIIGGELSFNDVSWYLSTMLFITMFSGMLVKLFDKIKRYCFTLFVAIVVSFLVPVLLILLDVDYLFKTWFLYYSFPMRLIDYSVGIIWGLIKRDSVSFVKNKKIFAVVSVIYLLIVQVVCKWIPVELRYAAIYLPVMGYLIYYFSEDSGVIGKILSNKCMVKIGDLCFYFYFCHYAIGKYFSMIIKQIASNGNVVSLNVIYIIITALVTFAVGIILKQFDSKRKDISKKIWFLGEKI